MSRAVRFLKKALGADFFDVLQKTELYKPDTRTTTSLEDIHLGMKLVPKTIMSILVRELVPMKLNEHKEINLPVDGEAKIAVEKLGPDVYSGQIFQNNKKLTEFAFRPIPGVALVIMSAFELYEAEVCGPAPVDAQAGSEKQIMQLVEERLNMHELVNRVVDQKLERRAAVQQIMLARLTSAMQSPPPPILPAPSVENLSPVVIEPKGTPLKGFLESRKTKLKKSEFFVSLEKHDTVDCAECGKEIFNESGYSGCICFGADRNSKVSIKKSETGVRISFGRGWDQENLEMLLEVLRSKRG